MIAAKQWAAVLKASKEYGLVQFDAARFSRKIIAAGDFEDAMRYLREFGLFNEKAYKLEWRARKKELKKKMESEQANSEEVAKSKSWKFCADIQPVSFPPDIVLELVQAMIDKSAFNRAMVLILKYGLHSKFSVVDVIRKMIAVSCISSFHFAF